ncbi:MAG: hypothetical protein QW097_02710, partial [archaeon]
IMHSFLTKLEDFSIRKRLWFMAILFMAILLLNSIMTLFNQYRHHQKTHLALLSSETITLAVDRARSGQVTFKKQVQEWKNTLLRAHEPSLREKYWSQSERRKN